MPTVSQFYLQQLEKGRYKKMPNTGFGKSVPLTDNSINRNVTKVSPSAYALGHTNNTATFVVEYVGRSDSDLNERLHQWVGDYDQFKAGYYPTAKAAFDKECTLYHDFGGSKTLDNKAHPACPADSDWDCPVSGCDYK